MAVREDEIAGLDATAQAALVAKGDISPLELVDATIACIEHINPVTNAIVCKTYDEARQWAKSPKLPQGPFRGVPFAFKDLGAHQKGMPYYLGNKALKTIDHRAAHDSELGARFRDAGLVTLGITHAPELGNLISTVPEAHGTCRNPWHSDYSAGGSSSGAAAAVASGMLAIAHGNDGGGSARLPAAWCGVVGLIRLYVCIYTNTVVFEYKTSQKTLPFFRISIFILSIDWHNAYVERSTTSPVAGTMN